MVCKVLCFATFMITCVYDIMKCKIRKTLSDSSYILRITIDPTDRINIV
jgi:hypothetical protein